MEARVVGERRRTKELAGWTDSEGVCEGGVMRRVHEDGRRTEKGRGQRERGLLTRKETTECVVRLIVV